VYYEIVVYLMSLEKRSLENEGIVEERVTLSFFPKILTYSFKCLREFICT